MERLMPKDWNWNFIIAVAMICATAAFVAHSCNVSNTDVARAKADKKSVIDLGINKRQ
jgi:hypothetical protein